MPRGDRTGPMGMGPRTGRAAGYCAGYPVPGYANPLPGAGAFGRGGAFGSGRGWGGRGHRNWYYATGLTGWQRAAAGLPPFAGGPAGGYAAPYPGTAPEEETKVIRNQIELMEENLEAARRRLEELEADQE
ncbi:MAG: DUF5320 domain-containing protein [Spirochaetales bacterium]|nr:DUF5320 domain-containing protein [Spirochaetales bacterium]